MTQLRHDTINAKFNYGVGVKALFQTPRDSGRTMSLFRSNGHGRRGATARRVLAALTLLSLTAPVSAWAQDQAQTAAPAAGPVPGYLDPQTNVFTPLPFLSDAATARAVAAAETEIVRTGTLVIVLKLTVDPATPSGATFSASAQGQTADAVFSTAVYAAGAVPVSGGAGTLRLRIPYAFTVSSTSTDVDISLSVYASTGASLTVTQSIPMPNNGATTTVVVNQKI